MAAIQNPAKEYMPMPLTGLDGDWRPLDYPGIAPGYQVSLYGEVRTPRGKIATPQLRKDKVIVALRRAGSSNNTTAQLAVLVLSTFSRHEPDMVPEYLDGDPANCQLINLRWREPTVYEERAKRAIATAREARGKGAKARKTKPKAIPATPPKVTPAMPRISGEVEVMRVYKHGGLVVPVTPTGEIPAKALPQGRLSAQKVASLAKILAMVVEMNTLMGMGK